VQAPGEAKAELAALNTQEVIDAVVSEDVDALVFGAKCVIQM
jgi:holliday junction resolvase YEN1